MPGKSAWVEEGVLRLASLAQDAPEFAGDADAFLQILVRE